jgi:transposase
LLEANETIDLKPSSCRQCGCALQGDGVPTRRHQTIEIPRVQPWVTEYRLHALRCPHCDILTESELPEGVPHTAFGATVHGWVGLLSGGFRHSTRNVKALLSDAFGLEVAEGTVWQLEQRVSDAVAAPVEEAQAHVQQQSAVNVDETSFREGKLVKWLWTAVTDKVTVFAIRLSRGRDVVRELLGEPGAAVVGSDRYVAYGDLPTALRQICWAHVIRNWEAFLERGGTATRVGEALLEHAHKLFTWWHRVRDGTLQLSSFQTYVAGLRQEIRLDLWYGQFLADDKTAATCRELLAVEPALYTFVRHPGVQPTNNSAERALRHGVIWRKTSFGTKTEAGSRYVERMLTVRETLRQQNRSMLDYLTEACQAHFRHTTPPSLLP